MSVQTSCPDAATLFRLRSGQLPDPYASEVRRHLATCPTCSRGTAGVPPGERRLKPAYSGAVSAEAARRAASGGSVTVSNAPRPTSDASPGGVLRPPEQPGELGRLAGYRVLRLLGQDGAGYVFEAEHVEHRVKVALQVVPPGGPETQRAKQRLLYGGAAASAYEVGQDGEVMFVATALPDAVPDADLPDAPLVVAPYEAPRPEPPRVKQYCPKCLGDLKEVGGKAWCAKCGYSSDDDQMSDETPPPRGAVVPFWAVLLVFGCFTIVAATAFRREFLPAGSAARVWWVLIEAGAGLALYLFGHVLIVVLIFRQWRDGELFKYIDPLTVTRYAFEFLPKTRWGICMMAWGLVAFLCAFVLFWMNDFALKDKKDRRPKVLIGAGGSLATDEGTATGEDPEAPEYIVLGEATLQDPAAAQDVCLIDPYGTDDPPERAEPPNTATCVVIGYVPDPNDPGKVGQLVLGTRAEDGSIRYAGTVANFAGGTDVDRGLSQVKSLKPLLQTPGYMPANLNAIPVEPSLVARVGFKERDAQGVLKSATVKGVGKEAVEPPGGSAP